MKSSNAHPSYKAINSFCRMILSQNNSATLLYNTVSFQVRGSVNIQKIVNKLQMTLPTNYLYKRNKLSTYSCFE